MANRVQFTVVEVVIAQLNARVDRGTRQLPQSDARVPDLMLYPRMHEVFESRSLDYDARSGLTGRHRNGEVTLLHTEDRLSADDLLSSDEPSKKLPRHQCGLELPRMNGVRPPLQSLKSTGFLELQHPGGQQVEVVVVRVVTGVVEVGVHISRRIHMLRYGCSSMFLQRSIRILLLICSLTLLVKDVLARLQQVGRLVPTGLFDVTWGKREGEDNNRCERERRSTTVSADMHSSAALTLMIQDCP